jgi:hypothetical protein
MKKPLILMLALMAFSTSSFLSMAQETRLADKARPKLFIGKVTKVDERAKIVIVSGKGGEKITLDFSNPKEGACKGGNKPSAPRMFPKVGENIVARVSACDDCLAIC